MSSRIHLSTVVVVVVVVLAGLVPSASAIVGDPAAQSRASVVTHVKTTRPYVAITVDDFYTGDYHRQTAIHMLQAANAVQAAMTLCPAGSALTAYNKAAPEQASQIKLLFAAGQYELCNHTFSHPIMPNLGPTAAQERELLAGQAAVTQFFGRGPSSLFRPPFGSWNAQTQEAAMLAGYKQMILWSIDSGDSEGPEKPVDMLLADVACAGPGDIILLHANRRSSADALPRILALLHQKGLTPVTLSTLLSSGTPAYSYDPADMRRLYTCVRPATTPVARPAPKSPLPVPPRRAPVPGPRPVVPVAPAPIPFVPSPPPAAPAPPQIIVPSQPVTPPVPNRDPATHNDPESRH